MDKDKRIDKGLVLPTLLDYKVMEDFRRTLLKRPYEYLEDGNYDVYLKDNKKTKDEKETHVSVHRKELIKIYSDLLELIKRKQKHINSQFVNPKFDIARHNFKCICKNSIKFQDYHFKSASPPPSEPELKANPSVKMPEVVEEKPTVKHKSVTPELDEENYEKGYIESSARTEETEHAESKSLIDTYFGLKSKEYSPPLPEKVKSTKLVDKRAKGVTFPALESMQKTGTLPESVQKGDSLVESMQKVGSLAESVQKTESLSSESYAESMERKDTYKVEDLMQMPSLNIEALHPSESMESSIESIKVKPKPREKSVKDAKTVDKQVEQIVQKVDQDVHKEVIDLQKSSLLNNQEVEMRNDLLHLLESVAVFSDLPKERLLELSSHFKLRSFFANTSIILAGEHPKEFYIVASGTVSSYVYDPSDSEDTYRLAYLSSDYFGESFIIDDTPSDEFYIADTHVTLQAMNSKLFKTLLADQFNAFKCRLTELKHYSSYGAHRLGTGKILTTRFGTTRLGTGKFGNTKFGTVRLGTKMGTSVNLDRFMTDEKEVKAYTVLGKELLVFMKNFYFFTKCEQMNKLAKKVTYQEYCNKEILEEVAKGNGLFMIFKGKISMQIYEQSNNRQLELLFFGPNSYFFNFKPKSETVSNILDRKSLVVTENVKLLYLAQKYVQKCLADSLPQMTTYLENLYKSRYIHISTVGDKVTSTSSSDEDSEDSVHDGVPDKSVSSSEVSESSGDDAASLSESPTPSKDLSDSPEPSKESTDSVNYIEPTLDDSESIKESTETVKESTESVKDSELNVEDSDSIKESSDSIKDSESTPEDSELNVEDSESAKDTEQTSDSVSEDGLIVSRRSFENAMDVSILGSTYRSEKLESSRSGSMHTREKFESSRSGSMHTSEKLESSRSSKLDSSRTYLTSESSVLNKIASRRSFEDPADVSIRGSTYRSEKLDSSRSSSSLPSKSGIMLDNGRIVSRRSFEDPVDVSIRGSTFRSEKLDSSRSSRVEPKESSRSSLSSGREHFMDKIMRKMESYKSLIYSSDTPKTTSKDVSAREVTDDSVKESLKDELDYEMIRRNTLMASHVLISDTDLTSRTSSNEKPESSEHVLSEHFTSSRVSSGRPLSKTLSSDQVEPVVNIIESVVESLETFEDENREREQNLFDSIKESDVGSVASDVKFIFNLPNLEGDESVRKLDLESQEVSEKLDSSRVDGNDNFVSIKTLPMYNNLNIDLNKDPEVKYVEHHSLDEAVEASENMFEDEMEQMSDKIVQRQTSSSFLLTSNSINYGDASAEKIARLEALDKLISKNYPTVQDSINTVVEVIRLRSLNTHSSITPPVLTPSVHSLYNDLELENGDQLKKDMPEEKAEKLDELGSKSPSLDISEIPNLKKILSKVHEMYVGQEEQEQSVSGSKFSSIDDVYIHLNNIEKLYSKSYTTEMDSMGPQVDNVPKPQADVEGVKMETMDSVYGLDSMYKSSDDVRIKKVSEETKLEDAKPQVDVVESVKMGSLDSVYGLNSMYKSSDSMFELETLYKQTSNVLNKSLSDEIYDTDQDEVLEQTEPQDTLLNTISKSFNTITQEFTVDNITKKLSIDDITDKFTLDNITEGMSIDGIAEKLSVDGITEKFEGITLDNLSREISNIGEEISGMLSSKSTVKSSSDVAEIVGVEEAEEEQGTSVFESSKLMISSIFDNISIYPSKTMTPTESSEQTQLEPKEEHEEEKDEGYGEVELSENNVFIDKYNLVRRISLDSSSYVSSTSSTERTTSDTGGQQLENSSGEYTQPNQTIEYSDGSSLLNFPAGQILESMDSVSLDMDNSVEETSVDNSASLDTSVLDTSVMDTSVVDMDNSAKDSGDASYLTSDKGLHSSVESFGTDAYSESFHSSDSSDSVTMDNSVVLDNSVTADNSVTIKESQESSDYSESELTSSSSIRSEVEKVTNTTSVSEDNRSLCSSLNTTTDTSTTSVHSSDRSTITDSSANTSLTESVSVSDSVDTSLTESFSSRRTSMDSDFQDSTDINNASPFSGLSDNSSIVYSKQFSDFNESQSDQQELEQDEELNVEEEEDYEEQKYEDEEMEEEYAETDETVDSYEEEEEEYDEEMILNIKNLFISTLKNKYKSIGASFNAMDLECTGMVTCEVFLSFIEKLGIGAIDHREQNLMFELLKEDNKDYITVASFYRFSGECVTTLDELNQHFISIFGSSRMAFERFFTTLTKATMCSRVDFEYILTQVGIPEKDANVLFDDLNVCKNDSVSVFTILKILVGDWDRETALEYEEKINTNFNRLLTYLTPEADNFNSEFTRTLSSQFFDQGLDCSLVNDSYEEFYIDRELFYFDELYSLISSRPEFSQVSLPQKRFIISLFNIITFGPSAASSDSEEDSNPSEQCSEEDKMEQVDLICSNEYDVPLIALISGTADVSFEGITYPKHVKFTGPSFPNYEQFIQSAQVYTTPEPIPTNKTPCNYNITVSNSQSKSQGRENVVGIMPLTSFIYNVVPLLNERSRRLPVMLQFLKTVPSFSVYTDEELDNIVVACTVRQFKLHETVIKTGEVPTHFYLIFNGSVTITNEFNFQFKTVSKGNFFSTFDIVNNQLNTFTVYANCTLVLLSWERSEFFRVFTKYATLLDNDSCNMDDFQNQISQKSIDKKVSFAETP
uniref:Cyclic nucleotide-binding domain containing protein, putative n=1 Tax=Theileria annulata TaxID=5874 RepID=A0A3B0N9M8_THEAN